MYSVTLGVEQDGQLLLGMVVIQDQLPSTYA